MSLLPTRALNAARKTPTGVPRVRLPQLQSGRYDPERKGLSPFSTFQRLVADTVDKYSNASDRERL